MATIFWVVLSAGAVGFLGALLGIGGGTFLVPVLILGFDLEPVHAMPISLICALGTGVSGIFSLPKNFAKNELSKAYAIETPAIFGALISTPFSYLFSGKTIMLIFAFFLFGAALIAHYFDHGGEVFSARVKERSIPTLVIGFITGVSAGLFGVGGGVLLVPLLRIFLAQPLERAVNISLFIMISTSTVALLAHLSLGKIDWGIALPCLVCVLPGGFFGGKMRKHFSDQKLRTIFLCFAGLVSTILTIRSLTR